MRRGELRLRPFTACRIDLDGELKIKVSAPALDSRANEAVCEFLAERLGLPRRAVTLLRGEKSRRKRIAVSGLDLIEAKQRLHV